MADELIWPRRAGKTFQMSEKERQLLLRNPKATIVRHRDGETIIETPVEGVRVEDENAPTTPSDTAVGQQSDSSS